MKKHVFLYILIIVLLGGLISVTLFISFHTSTPPATSDYEAIPSSYESKEVSLSGFNYGKVVYKEIGEYKEFTTQIKENEDISFLNSLILDSSNLEIGQTFQKNTLLGLSNGIEKYSEGSGVILDKVAENSKINLIFTNQESLYFEASLQQNYLYLISYDMNVEVQLTDGSFTSAYVNKIDYENIENGFIPIRFSLVENVFCFLPNMEVLARIVLSPPKSTPCLPVSFFTGLNRDITYKIFTVYYFKDQQLLSGNISTGAILDNYVILVNMISSQTEYYLNTNL